MNSIYEIINNRLEESINDIFLELQEKFHVNNGDCDPFDSVNLDDRRERLAHKIEQIFMSQAASCITKREDNEYVTEQNVYQLSLLVTPDAKKSTDMIALFVDTLPEGLILVNYRYGADGLSEEEIDEWVFKEILEYEMTEE